MTEVAERYYVPRLPLERLAGLAVTRHGYGRPTRHIPVIEAGHPVPDKSGISATKRTLRLPTRWTAKILCWCFCPAALRQTG